MKNKLGELIAFMIIAILTMMYVFGSYKIITDDENYHTKDVIVGVVLPPYPIYIGIKESIFK